MCTISSKFTNQQQQQQQKHLMLAKIQTEWIIDVKLIFPWNERYNGIKRETC